LKTFFHRGAATQNTQCKSKHKEQNTLNAKSKKNYLSLSKYNFELVCDILLSAVAFDGMTMFFIRKVSV